MKKVLLTMAVLIAGVALAAAPKTPASGSVPMTNVSVQIKLAEDGDQLWCHIRFKGIEARQTIQYRFRWTAPDVVFTPKKGDVVKLFLSTVYPVADKPALVAGDSSSQCYCRDSGEKGCFRSKAYRTLKTTLDNGKTFRALGTWKVEILDDADGTVLGSLSYDVK